MPIRCQTSGEINVKNLPDGTYQVRYTANDESPADTQIGSNQEVSGGSDVTFTMPEAGVVTVFDVNYLTGESVSTSGILSGAAISGAILG